MHRQRGLTVIELVLTVAILAVLAVMVIPGLGKWIQRNRIKGAVREIVSQMELAKIKALKYNLEYQLEFTPGEGKFQLKRGDRPSGSKDWTLEGREITVPSQVRIDIVTFPSDAAQFNPHGTASTGRVELISISGERYRIQVTTSTGKITTERAN